MRRYLAFVVAIAGLGCGGSADADGLIFQLPPDGSWARYTVETDGAVSVGELKQPIKGAGTLTISSVGKITRNQQSCRWIELKSESQASENQTEGFYPKLVLKMLIAERNLRRGRDPLAHSILTFFDPKPIDEKKAPLVESFIDDGFNRIQYEIDRFRGDFPKPLYDVKTLPRETVETPAGRFENCEILTGTCGHDGQLLHDGREVFRGTYRIVLHPDAPFGVVAMSMESDGREIGDGEAIQTTYKRTLRLTATGKDAVSDLPDKPAKKMPE